MAAEHLTRDSDLLWELGCSFAQGHVPAEVIPLLRLGRITALQKPSGGIRGIVVGDVFRRLVARTMAQQLNAAVERATSHHSCRSGVCRSCRSNSHRFGSRCYSVVVCRRRRSFRFDIERGDAARLARCGRWRGSPPICVSVLSTVRPPTSGRTMPASPTTLSKEKGVNRVTP